MTAHIGTPLPRVALDAEALMLHVQSQSDPKVTYILTTHGSAVTCSCPGYLARKNCKHAKGVKEILMESNNRSDETAVAFMAEGRTSQDMALRLADTKQRLALVHEFFRDVMVEGQDYGVIPGTDKPTLLKPGAEKLTEFYGYAIEIAETRETIDRETGFYRSVVTVRLSRGDGRKVAEGVGEANTMEGRYRSRWVTEAKLPPGIDKAGLKFEERPSKFDKGGTYKMYRVENDDPWTLWNTVLKMAKKRALIDATLSATRSSGIFTQDVEELREWMSTDDGNAVSTPPRAPAPRTTPAERTERRAASQHRTGSATGTSAEPVGDPKSPREQAGAALWALAEACGGDTTSTAYLEAITPLQATYAKKLDGHGNFKLSEFTDMECGDLKAALDAATAAIRKAGA